MKAILLALTTLLATPPTLGGVPMASALELRDVTYNTPGAGEVVFSHKRHLQRKNNTTKPFVCKTCHKSGSPKTTHTMAELERGQACGACHNGTGAFAVVRCTRCHHVREIAYYIKAAGPVQFSHKAHVRNMNCSVCHNTIVNAGPNRPVSMAEMNNGKRCGACHNGGKAFSLGECARCHPFRDINFTVKGGGMVTFRHGVHLRLYSCAECHPGLYRPGRGNGEATMAEMEQHRACGACHDGKTAFSVTRNCATCHKV